ncbi:hypothetical protein TNCV_1665651 [Trichonephila clavipes]|nr:hypothetical protein TNCV_1665651 [Trichonephila clavipes]
MVDAEMILRHVSLLKAAFKETQKGKPRDTSLALHHTLQETCKLRGPSPKALVQLNSATLIFTHSRDLQIFSQPCFQISVYVLTTTVTSQGFR